MSQNLRIKVLYSKKNIEKLNNEIFVIFKIQIVFLKYEGSNMKVDESGTVKLSYVRANCANSNINDYKFSVR